MAIFAILLVVSLCMFGVYWGASSVDGESVTDILLREPVLCNREAACPECMALGVILSLYVGVCYWAAFAYVFPNAEIFFTKWLLTKPLEALERCFSRHDIHEKFMHWRPRFPTLWVSHILQAVWWAASLVLSASLRLWGLEESRAGRVEGSESDWSVGQILSLLLICLPVLSAVEIYFEEENENKAQETTQIIPQPTT
ncbi:hypothetical protein B0T14DRAFT_565860 [Immersiella caudata]|uniref:Uncharacterized protein n=1 Tax=Immersiella caudata TaxID=314043 RepID=A0AA39WP33_9PEZI|nr:hypothetical protein B0T14DRAFT_565860 [Immersiella caudata]